MHCAQIASIVNRQTTKVLVVLFEVADHYIFTCRICVYLLMFAVFVVSVFAFDVCPGMNTIIKL